MAAPLTVQERAALLLSIAEDVQGGSPSLAMTFPGPIRTMTGFVTAIRTRRMKDKRS
jgi:hypothetical protein